MARTRFEGFSPSLFRFLRGLTANNNKEWFDAHRRQYEDDLLGVAKAFVGELGPILHMLNQELETEPRVGRTLSRISNDMRFHKNRPPYRPHLYIGFSRRGEKWSCAPLLYVGIFPHGVSVGFYPGGHHELQTGPIQNAIKDNIQLFQRYLRDRRIAKNYSELAGGDNGSTTKWPLPRTARKWVNLESFTVGEYFESSDPALGNRGFLDRTQRIMIDLYPLWLFSSSTNLKDDLELYSENAAFLSRPLSTAAD
ncbi:MAG TPA: DUF2461 family protein [Blastocatellia bacterium]|nr:DUF2461 family protein [Blastocatellia bacterium]